MMKMLGAAVAAATCLAATNATAFAYFTPISSDPMFTVTAHDHPMGRMGVDITPLATAGQANIKFTFAGLEGHAWEPYAAGLYALGALDAHLAFSASELPFPNDKSYQSMGTIKITYAGANPITANGNTYHTGAVLYENTTWLGKVSPSTGVAAFFGSGDSAFLPGSFAWGYIWGFNYTTSGQGPSLTAALSNGFIDYAVPEPSTWAMLIVGFGLTGAALRRRRYARVVA